MGHYSGSPLDYSGQLSIPRPVWLAARPVPSFPLSRSRNIAERQRPGLSLHPSCLQTLRIPRQIIASLLKRVLSSFLFQGTICLTSPAGPRKYEGQSLITPLVGPPGVRRRGALVAPPVLASSLCVCRPCALVQLEWTRRKKLHPVSVFFKRSFESALQSAVRSWIFPSAVTPDHPHLFTPTSRRGASVTMPPPTGHHTWNFDIDRFLNPIVPSPPWAYIPYPVAHFLGYRKAKPANTGNLMPTFWAFVGIFCAIIILQVVSMHIPSFESHHAPAIVGSFVRIVHRRIVGGSSLTVCRARPLSSNSTP